MRRPWECLLMGVAFLLAAASTARAAGDSGIELLPLQVFSGERDAEDTRILIEGVMAARLQGEEGLKVIHRTGEKAPPEGYSEEQARAQGERDAVGWVLWGSLTQAGRLLSLDLRLLSVAGTKPVSTIFVQASDREQLLAQIDAEMEKLLSRIMERKKVVEIRVEGNRRIGVDAVLLRTKVRVGDDFSLHRVQADIREIDKMGYFEDVQVHVEDAKGGKVVVFLVKEKPTVREVVITGNDKIDTDKILEVVTIQPQSILNYQALGDTVQKIKKLYQEKGFYGAQISYELKELEGNQKGVVFRIQEGKKFWIKTISFEGNERFSDKELKKQMKTKEKDWLHWFTDSGVLDQETLKQDVERLSNFYYNQGFLKNRIGTPRIENDEEWIYITIAVEEGDRYKIGSLRLEGDLLEPEEVMLKSLKVRQGDFFNRDLLRRDILDLTERYADRGYAYADVKPTTQVNDAEKTVDIVLRVQQKQKVHIGRIRITGNTKTRDKVIRRELQLNEGDTFSSTALKKSNERLKALKYFEEVNVTTTPGPTEDVVDLNVEVKEQQTGSFSVGAGYSSIDKLVGVAEITQTNLFGRGYKVRLKAEVGSKRQYYDFSFLDPYLFDTRVAMRFDLFNIEREYVEFTRRAQGGDLLFERPLDFISPRLRGLIGYRAQEVEMRDIDKDAAQIFKEQEGRYLTSEILASLTWDTRNHPLYPSRGTNTALTTEFAGLGGDTQFVKHVISSAWYFPVVWDTVFMVRGEFGTGYGWGGKELPVFERFFLGGLNSIRGFKPGGVGPRDPKTEEIIGGDKELFFNLEYIFPILKKLELRGVVFADIGNAYLGSIDITNMRRTVGTGIRWQSPLGPIRVEIGYNLKPEFDEKAFEWAFGMGGGF